MTTVTKNAVLTATAAEIEMAERKEIERDIKYTHKGIFNKKMEITNYKGEIETLNKVNELCEREFNARLARNEKYSYAEEDLIQIAETIGENLQTAKRREELIAACERGLKIEQAELAELEKKSRGVQNTCAEC